MENENNQNEETKIPQPKKKKNKVLYWGVVVLGSAFIFAGSMNIGSKLAEINEPKETVIEEKEESNIVDEDINNSNSNGENNQNNIEKKDAKYFDEYLKAFTGCNGDKIKRNVDKFSDVAISNFVINYVMLNADKSNTSGEYVEEMTISDVDALVYKYFNTKDYKLSSQDSVTKITKDGNSYKFEWSAVGCGYTSYNNPVVTYNGENVTVKYDLSDARDKKQIGTATFHLKYNNGNYNLVKIEQK